MTPAATRPHVRRHQWSRPPIRMALTLAGVLLAAAGALRALDSVPSWLRGEPRSVRRYATLAAFERDVRTQLLLPFYFPDSLVWPPDAVFWAAGEGRPVSVVFTDRGTGRPRLVIVQCLDGDCPLPDRLLPKGREEARRAADVNGAPATWTRRVDAGGTRWTDIEWREHGRCVVVRLAGDDTDLLRFARSMRRGLP